MKRKIDLNEKHTNSINRSNWPISSGNETNLLLLIINTSKFGNLHNDGGIYASWFRLEKENYRIIDLNLNFKLNLKSRILSIGIWTICSGIDLIALW